VAHSETSKLFVLSVSRCRSSRPRRVRLRKRVGVSSHEPRAWAALAFAVLSSAFASSATSASAASGGASPKRASFLRKKNVFAFVFLPNFLFGKKSPPSLVAIRAHPVMRALARTRYFHT
jgi:hypothetical protein